MLEYSVQEDTVLEQNSVSEDSVSESDVVRIGELVRPLHIRGFRRGRPTPSAKVFDSHEDTSQQHEDIGQDDHHRVDRDRLLGHNRCCGRKQEDSKECDAW